MRIRNSELRLGIQNKGNLYFGIINNKFVIKKKNNKKELDLIQDIFNSLELTRNNSHLWCLSFKVLSFCKKIMFRMHLWTKMTNYSFWWYVKIIFFHISHLSLTPFCSVLGGEAVNVNVIIFSLIIQGFDPSHILSITTPHVVQHTLYHFK